MSNNKPNLVPHIIRVLPSVLSLFLLFVTIGANAQTSGEEESTRPKVGLALSGGGAKGFAQVGVLKVLEEIDFPIDYISGNSIGSIVGGFYAMGYSVDSITSIIHSIDWEAEMTDNVERRHIPLIVRKHSDRYQVSFPFNKEGLKIPIGIFQGQNIQKIFARYSIPYHEETDFDSLPIPFRAVAVDALHGKEIVLSKGVIADAMRASMSIPGVFDPVEIDSILLMDGMLVNNFPVDVCRDMGADVVIGIDIQQDPITDYGEITSIYSIVDNMINWLAEDKYKQNVESSDIYIRPNIAQFSSADFQQEKIDSLILVGESEARKMLPSLLAFRDSLSLREERVNFVLPSCDTITIRDVTLVGVDKSHDEDVEARLGFEKGEPISIGTIETGVDRVYGTGRFIFVKYRLVDRSKDGDYTLELRLKEKQKSVLNVGIHYDDQNNAALLLNTTFWGKSMMSTRLSIDMRLSSYPALAIDYTKSRGARPALGAQFEFLSERIPFYDKDDLTGYINIIYNNVAVDLHSVLWDNVYFKIGPQLEVFNAKQKLNVPSNIDVKDDWFINYSSSIFWDNLDSQDFYSKGSQLKLQYDVITNSGNPLSSKAQHYIDFWFKTAIPLSSKLTLIPSIYSRSILGGDPSIYNRNLVGGVEQFDYLDNQVPFMGLINKGLICDRSFIFRTDLRWRVIGNHNLIFKGNYGRFFDVLDIGSFDLYNPDQYTNINSQDIFGWGVTYSYQSLVGPLDITISGSDYNSGTVSFLSLGYWF